MTRLILFPGSPDHRKGSVSKGPLRYLYPTASREARNRAAPSAFNRPSAAAHTVESALGLKLFGLIPFLTFSYVLTFHHLLGFVFINERRARGDVAPNFINRSFWLGLAVVTIFLALCYLRQLEWGRLKSPVCISLVVFFTFAAASVTWAYSPDLALSRVSVAIIVALTILLPYTQRASEYDTVKGLYRCYVFAIFVSALFVANEAPMLTALGTVFGYQGYFTFKGSLGQCGAAALLFSVYALRFRGWDRVLAPIVMAVSLWLIVVSHSKGSLALLLISPLLAVIVLGIRRATKTPLIAVCAACLAGYFFATLMISDLTGKISYSLYGDPTFTGRTFIWQFAEWQMTRSPWLGWGFHSFWLVGPKAPSVVEAPQWISSMTGSHSGYLDVRLETGFIGYSLFIAFLAATLHSIDRVVSKDAMRGWLLLSIAFYVMTTNILETVWLYNDPLWLLFLFVGADALRYLDAGRQPPRNVGKQIGPRAPKLLRVSAPSSARPLLFARKR
jgi:exopolysaccharide production protein ExoQ